MEVLASESLHPGNRRLRYIHHQRMMRTTWNSFTCMSFQKICKASKTLTDSMISWPKWNKPTSGSTAGKHGYGTPAANSPPISRPLGPKYGLAARASQDTNKDSPFWEPPWELRSTNNTTCNTYAPNTTNSYNNFHTSKTCRRLGYSSSTAQAPVAYTNSGCCLPTWSGQVRPVRQRRARFRAQAQKVKICTQLLFTCGKNLQTNQNMPPNITAQFSQDHDAVAACLSELLDAGAIPATSLAIAHLPLNQGGLGLTSASVTATPVHWASWADILPVLYNQMPQHAETLLHQLQHPLRHPQPSKQH